MEIIIKPGPNEKATLVIETQERQKSAYTLMESAKENISNQHWPTDESGSYAKAMETVIAELRKDKSPPNSMYFVWQSNIAGTVRDYSDLDYDAANKIATKFLDLLMM